MLINKKSQAGLSIIEIIIAVSLFTVLAATSMGTILGSLSTGRLGIEENQANFLANEALEATESIRNQNWSSLTNGNHGLTKSGNLWSFSGSSDVDSSGKYTRVVNVADVYRDGSGNIVTSGGTLDSGSKKMTVTVSWNFTPTRNNNVTKEFYLTNWQLSVNHITGSSPPPSVTPMPSPTLPATSCGNVCQNYGFATGYCHSTPTVCNAQTLIYYQPGDVFCTGGQNGDTCCCSR